MLQAISTLIIIFSIVFFLNLYFIFITYDGRKNKKQRAKSTKQRARSNKKRVKSLDIKQPDIGLDIWMLNFGILKEVAVYQSGRICRVAINNSTACLKLGKRFSRSFKEWYTQETIFKYLLFLWPVSALSLPSLSLLVN